MSLTSLSGQSDDEKLRVFRLRWMLVIGGILLAAAFYFGPGLYLSLKRYAIERRVAAAIAKGDEQEAIFQLQLILQQSPDDNAALQQLARIGEKQHAPWVLQVRKRIFDLNPNDPAAALDLAEEACRSHRLELARSAVTNLAKSGDASRAASAQNILGMVAAQRGNRAEALVAFQKAYELKPESTPIIKNYAAFLLSDPNQNHTETVLSLIQKVEKDPASKLTADRLRLALELKNGKLQAAREIADFIVTQPGHLFADELQRVTLLALQDPGNAEQALDLLCQNVEQEHAIDLLLWLHTNGHNRRAIELIEKLPKTARNYQTVRLIEIEALLRLKEYDKAQARLEASSWGEFEPMRLAALANLFQLRGETEKSTHTREAAINKALAAQEILPLVGPLLLNYISKIEEWQPEREQLLWGMAESPVLADDALRWLLAMYQQKRDARGLARVFMRLTNRHPGEKVFLNNAVSLALLTGVNRQWGFTSAKSLFEQYPSDPVIQSTYAYALALENRPSEAYQIVSKMDPKLLRKPEFALYYGYVLRANGMTSEAKDAAGEANPDKLLDAEADLLKEISK